MYLFLIENFQGERKLQSFESIGDLIKNNAFDKKKTQVKYKRENGIAADPLKMEVIWVRFLDKNDQ